MPADGMQPAAKKGDFGTSRWRGLNVRLHQPGDRAEADTTSAPQWSEAPVHFGACILDADQCKRCPGDV